MRKWSAGLLAALPLLTGAAAVEAAPIPIPTLLADFNAIVNGQFNSTSDVQGPVLIGGDLGPGTVSLNSTCPASCIPLPIPIPGYQQINVFGNHTAAFNNTKGNVLVGGPSAGTFPGVTSVTFNNIFPNNFATDIFNPLKVLSQTTLAGLPVNSTFVVNSVTHIGTFNFNLQTVNGVPNVAVVNVTTAQLAQAIGALVFNGLTAATGGAYINVIDAGSFSQTFSYASLTPLRNLVWNFELANAVTINNQWEASILAPNALVMNTAPIEGDLVANVFGGPAPIGSGELHFLPLCSATSSPLLICQAAVIQTPEPGTMALLGAALAAYGVLRRRRV